MTEKKMEEFPISDFELHLKSTVGDLHLFDYEVDINKKLNWVTKELNSDFRLPGVILTKNGEYFGFVSRKQIFERISKPFGLDLYIRRPILFFYETIDSSKILLLQSSMLVVDAVQTALQRELDHYNDPIILEFENNTKRILDSYVLMIAYSRINLLAMKALNEANELKTDLLSMAAHDLKNPISTIIGLSKLLTSLIENNNSEQMDIAININDISKGMFKIIDELLNSTVIESGRMQLRKQILDLGELVNVVIYQNKFLADKKNQIIEHYFDINDEYIILGDALKIRESIENLISNAIKYSPFNSKIAVKLEHKGKNILFSVKDNGPGINKTDMKKIFGKFQRLSALPTGNESSTGLGLFIAKQIVELHDGKLFVESELGKGSTFFIELPLSME